MWYVREELFVSHGRGRLGHRNELGGLEVYSLLAFLLILTGQAIVPFLAACKGHVGLTRKFKQSLG